MRSSPPSTAACRTKPVSPTRRSEEIVVALVEEHRCLSLLLAPGDDCAQSGFGVVDPAGRGHHCLAVTGKPDVGVTLAGRERDRNTAPSQRAHEAEIADNTGERPVAPVKTYP